MLSSLLGVVSSPKFVKIAVLTALIFIVIQLIRVSGDSFYSNLSFPQKDPEVEIEFHTDTLTETATLTSTSTEIRTSAITVREHTTVTADLELDTDVYTKDENTAIQEILKELSLELINEYDKSDINLHFLTKISLSMKQKYGKTFRDDHALKGKKVSKVTKHIVDNLIGNDIGNIDSKMLPWLQSRHEYYRYIIEELLLPNKPQIEKLSKEEIGNSLGGKGKYVKTDDPRFSFDYINLVNLKPEKLQELKKRHGDLVKRLRELPFPPKRFFSGRGIVIPASGEILPGALVTLGQLRELGSKLPIEVILNNEGDYDKHICEDLFPKLNAECVILEREIGKKLLDSLQLTGFQLKALTLLVSKFDHTLLLDADNHPVKNVDSLFDSEIYGETKFIVWPDLLSSGISPQFYEIAGIEVGELVYREGLKNDGSWEEYSKLPLNEVAFYDRDGTVPGMSIESGQMLFSKVEHIRALILSMYYNIFGNGLYYHLLYQGAWGWGDKDTFHTALQVLGEPYFLSEYISWHLGWMKGNDLHDTTVVQHDPVQAYSFMKKWRAWLKSKGLDTRLKFAQENKYTKDLVDQFLNDHDGEKLKIPDVLFLHIHNPKINPQKNAYPGSEKDGIYSRRGLGLPNAYKEYLGETDWELRLQSIAKFVTCDMLSKEFWSHHKKKPEEVCESITAFVEFLKKDTLYPQYEKLEYLKLAFGKDKDN